MLLREQEPRATSAFPAALGFGVDGSNLGSTCHRRAGNDTGADFVDGAAAIRRHPASYLASPHLDRDVSGGREAELVASARKTMQEMLPRAGKCRLTNTAGKST